jgi:hypothetical protein
MSSLTNANNDTSSKNVTPAAQDFMKAASILIESASMDIGVKTVQELMKVLPTSSSNMEQRFNNLQETYDSQINTINERLLTLESNHAASITDDQSTTPLTKHQIISWALDNVKTNQFRFSKSYYEDGYSGECVTETLKCFLRGFGRHLPNEYYILVSKKSSSDSPPTKEDKQAFRDALSRHLQDLLVHKPRIVLEEGDDRYCVYYS